MTKEEKLISLLQPKDYKSKIKLYCNDSEFSIQKFVQLKNNHYICREKQIKIEELRNGR